MLMDISFQNFNEVLLPPHEVRWRLLRIDPWSDRRRLKVSLEVTPFQKRPSVELVVYAPDGAVVASIDIIEMILPVTQMTVHLRAEGDPPIGQYRARACLYYATLGEPDADGPLNLPEQQIVDTIEIVFWNGAGEAAAD